MPACVEHGFTEKYVTFDTANYEVPMHSNLTLSKAIYDWMINAYAINNSNYDINLWPSN